MMFRDFAELDKISKRSLVPLIPNCTCHRMNTYSKKYRHPIFLVRNDRADPLEFKEKLKSKDNFGHQVVVLLIIIRL